MDLIPYDNNIWDNCSTFIEVSRDKVRIYQRFKIIDSFHVKSKFDTSDAVLSRLEILNDLLEEEFGVIGVDADEGAEVYTTLLEHEYEVILMKNIQGVWRIC